MRASVRLAVSGFLFSFLVSAADVTGIWMGQIAGRNNEKQDIAFQFRPADNSRAGVMFGDEFDLPVEDLRITGDRIRFSVTSVNYYDGRRIKFVFSGIVNGRNMELTRERAGSDEGASPAKRQDGKQTFSLRRLS